MPMKPFPDMTFGADPELFVVDRDGVGVCPTFLEGTKENPEPVKGGALQRDGMAAEFNIDPVDSYEQWEANFRQVLKTLKSRLPEGHMLVASPSMVFSEKVWEEAPDDAKELGCSPDYNAWTEQVNPPPDGEKKPRMRTAAGHIHLGWTDGASVDDEDYTRAARDLVKQLDWYIGAPSLHYDGDKVRRSLYGKAGAMRFKPYGVEYRVPSNFWVDNPAYRRWVWDRMQSALFAMAKTFYPDYVESTPFVEHKFNDRLVKSINTSRKDSILFRNFPEPLRNC